MTRKNGIVWLVLCLLMVFAGTANARWTSSITFEGDVKNDHQTTVQVVEPTQDNLITVPDTTAVLTLDLASVADANATLTNDQCGETIFLNDSTEFTTYLPAVSTTHTGCTFTFVVQAAAASADYRVNTGNSLENKIYGTLVVADALVACSAEDTITFVDANNIGDYVTIMDDGTQWFIVHSRAETSAKLTCTAFD